MTMNRDIRDVRIVRAPERRMECPECGHLLPVSDYTECDQCGAHLALKAEVVAPGVEP